MHTDQSSGDGLATRPVGPPTASPPPAVPADPTEPTPESARHLLVETLLRVGLDLQAALALAEQEPVSRHLRSAVGHVDEALRRVRRCALDEADAVINAPSGSGGH